jgi:hypothetical protein
LISESTARAPACDSAAFISRRNWVRHWVTPKVKAV